MWNLCFLDTAYSIYTISGSFIQNSPYFPQKGISLKKTNDVMDIGHVLCCWLIWRGDHFILYRCDFEKELRAGSLNRSLIILLKQSALWWLLVIFSSNANTNIIFCNVYWEKLRSNLCGHLLEICMWNWCTMVAQIIPPEPLACYLIYILLEILLCI